jgi:hypothetical protein
MVLRHAEVHHRSEVAQLAQKCLPYLRSSFAQDDLAPPPSEGFAGEAPSGRVRCSVAQKCPTF